MVEPLQGLQAIWQRAWYVLEDMASLQVTDLDADWQASINAHEIDAPVEWMSQQVVTQNLNDPSEIYGAYAKDADNVVTSSSGGVAVGFKIPSATDAGTHVEPGILHLAYTIALTGDIPNFGDRNGALPSELTDDGGLHLCDLIYTIAVDDAPASTS